MKVNQLKIGAILSYIVIGLNMIVGLAYTPVLIRMLGQSEYGLYSLVASIISYLTVLDLGFGNAIIIYTARFRAKKQEKEEHKLYGMFIIIYTIIGIIAAIGGVILYLNINNLFGNSMTSDEIEIAKKMMLILTFNLAITFPFSIFGNIITAYEKFVFSKIIKIVQIIVVPCIMLPLLFLGYKSITMVMVTTVVNVACLLANTIVCLKALKIRIEFGKFNIPLLKEIFAYSFFIFLNQIIDKVNWSLDQFILGTVAGTVAVAIYSAAAQFNTMYLAFSTAISNVLLPKVTKMEAQNASDEEFTEIFIKTGRIQYIVMALILTGFLLFGQTFINVWAGEGYETAYYIACIMMIPVTVPLIQNIGLSILQAKNKYKYRTIIFLGIAILNVALSIPLAKSFGGVGSAIGTSISLILGQIIILNIYYHKVIHINMIEFWKNILKMSIPVLLAFGFCFIINCFIPAKGIIMIAIEGIIYVAIYAGLMWIMGMNSYEKNLITKPINKILAKIKNKDYIKAGEK